MLPLRYRGASSIPTCNRLACSLVGVLGSRCYSTSSELAAKSSAGLDRLRTRRVGGKADLFALPKTPARTRFAPSPTGYLHLGSLRTALYNYLLARATGGRFIIRVEDTDRTRIVADAEARLYDDLKWAQLDWDEAPDIGGMFGPYRQSDRLPHYHKYANELLESGKAYRCFCSSHDLEKHKEHAATNRQSTNYPGTCRSIPKSEAEQRASDGEVHVIRFKANGTVSIVDRVYGRFTKNEEEDDFILIKSDKFPTYHFANVVDDHLMEITHVIRGAEWLISTPKHVALYNAFGWTPPEFGHVGLLTDSKGQKLSKRNQDIDISSYRRQGVLPSALTNWAALLGWSMGSGNNEVVKNLEELVQKFSFKFTKGNIQVNMNKLETFEHRHLANLLREDPLDVTYLSEVLLNPMFDAIKRINMGKTDDEKQLLLGHFSNQQTAHDYILRVLQANSTKYPKPVDVLLQNPYLVWSIPSKTYRLSVENSANDADTMDKEDQVLNQLYDALSAIPEPLWTQAGISKTLTECIVELKAKTSEDSDQENPTAFVHSCIRFAVVGDPNVPCKASSVVLGLIGKNEALTRLQAARNALKMYRPLNPVPS
ncbi:putative glutamate--tRNA ligase, mitochondrial [Ceratocystis lukuohia]